MTPRIRPHEAKRRFAQNIMFWLGVAYLVICVDAMTPYTFQLDDIKFALVHILGPVLTVAYLVLLALKMVDPPRPVYFVPLLAYMGVMVVSTLSAEPVAHWVGWQTTMMQWALLGPLLAFMSGCEGKTGARRGLYVFVLMLLWSTIFGLAHRLGFATVMMNHFRESGALEGGDPSFLVKMAATFSGAQGEMMSIILNREFYGGFIALTLPMALGALLLSRNHLWQAACGATVALAGVCLLLTGSKGCWAAGILALLLFGIMYFFVARLQMKYHKQILAVGAGAVVIAGVMSILIGGAIFGQIKSLGLSFSSRAIIWGGAVGIWKDFPFLGGAPGCFRIYFPMHRRPDYFLYDISHVTISSHNYFLDLLCDTGVLGFITFMTFLGVVYWKLIRRARKDVDRENRIVSIALISGMTGFLLSSLTSPCARWAVGAAFLWSAFGLLASVVQRPIQTETSATPPAPSPSPSIAQQGSFQIPAGLAWALVALNLWGAVFAANFGINFFRASMANNDGVTELGDGTRNGPVSELKTIIESRRKSLEDTSLSTADRAKLEAELPQYMALYEEHWQRAYDAFTSAVHTSPSMVTSWYKLGSLLSSGKGYESSRENYLDALKIYKKIEQYWPDYSQTPLNLGTVYMSLGDVDRSLPYLKRAVAQTLDPETNTLYIRMLLQHSQDEPAQPGGEIVTTETKTSRRAEAMRTATRLLDGWDETLGFRVTGGGPNGITSGSSVQCSFTRSVRWANEQKEKTLADVAEIYTSVARTVGDKKALMRGLMRLHLLSPGEESVISHIMQQYREAGDYDNLERFLQGIVEENPLSVHGRYWLGAAYLEGGKLRDAKREAILLERIEPKFPDAKYLSFNVYRCAGDNEKARRYAEEYVKIGTDPGQVKIAEQFLRPGKAGTDTALPAPPARQ